MIIDARYPDKKDRMTPKQKAEDMLIDAIMDVVTDWEDHWLSASDHMTDREKYEVFDQLDKIEHRLLKILGTARA